MKSSFLSLVLLSLLGCTTGAETARNLDPGAFCALVNEGGPADDLIFLCRIKGMLEICKESNCYILPVLPTPVAEQN